MDRPVQALPGGWQLTGLPAALHTLYVDTALMTLGQAVLSVSGPEGPRSQADLSPGDGLMLGSAAAVMADLTGAEEVLTAFAAALRIHPQNFRRSRPVLQEICWQGFPCRIVQDGKSRRAYLTGPADALTAACGTSLPEQRDGPSIGLATALVREDGSFAPDFLGGLAIGDVPNGSLEQALRTLACQGLAILRTDRVPDALPADAAFLSLNAAACPTLIPPDIACLGLTDAVLAVQAQIGERERQERQASLRRSVLCAVLLIVPGFLLGMAPVLLTGGTLPLPYGALMSAACTLLPWGCLRLLRRRTAVLLCAGVLSALCGLGAVLFLPLAALYYGLLGALMCVLLTLALPKERTR